MVKIKFKVKENGFKKRGDVAKCGVCEIKFKQWGPNHKYCSDCGSLYQSKSNLRLRFEIFKRDNFTCQYCGRNIKDDKVRLEVDHIIAVNNIYRCSKISPKKLITSCWECNRGKGNIPLEFKKFKKL